MKSEIAPVNLGYVLRDHVPEYFFGFWVQEKNIRPQADPINAMLSFGYAMLYGNCCVSVIGARLNPDVGLMHEGKGSLVQDLIDPLKTEMIDAAVFQVARESLSTSDYELIPDRCMLQKSSFGSLSDYSKIPSITKKLMK